MFFHLPHITRDKEEIRLVNKKILTALDKHLTNEYEKIKQLLFDGGIDEAIVDEVIANIRSDSHLKLIKKFTDTIDNY